MKRLRGHAPLLLILLIAFALRLLAGLGEDPLAVYGGTGSDSGWYLANGYALVTGQQPPEMVTDVSRLPTPPGYLVFLGVLQALLPRPEAVIAARILQALMGALTCAFAYGFAWRLTEHERAGMIAAALIAFSPAFILESARITSETLYIFLAVAGMWVYVEALAGRGRLRGWAAAGALLGLATLTRAVLLLFPVGLAAHLIWSGRRAGVQRALMLLAVYALVVSTWTVYNLARWNRLVIGGEGFAAFLYLGATGWDDPEVVDQRLTETLGEEDPLPDQEDFIAGAGSAILSDPLGYIGRRVGELIGAYLQPHGTAYYAGESLRDLTVNWLRAPSLDGLIALVRGDAFPQKLLLYVVHYGVLVTGVIGLWGYRRVQAAAPLVLFILYTTVIHLVLLALPRYIFPTMVIWSAFAAAALSGGKSAGTAAQRNAEG